MLEIICLRRETCAFRVHEDYFKQKTRFSAGSCPVCGGPLRVVQAGTDNHAANMVLQGDPDRSRFREIVDTSTWEVLPV